MNEDVPELTSYEKTQRLLETIQQVFKGSKRVYPNENVSDVPVVQNVIPIKPKDDFGF